MLCIRNCNKGDVSDVELEWDSQENSTKKEEKSEPVLNKEKTLLGYNKPLHPESEEEYPSTPEFLQSPKLIPPIFDGSQLLAFGLFPDQVPNAVTIKAQSPDGPLTLKIEVPLICHTVTNLRLSSNYLYSFTKMFYVCISTFTAFPTKQRRIDCHASQTGCNQTDTGTGTRRSSINLSSP